MKRACFFLCVLVLLGCGGENANEKLADRVTQAIINNDVKPVEQDFNALTRPKLTRGAVGRLSDQLNALGKFQRTHETTPKDAASGRHVFEAVFDKATWHEDLTLDEDGKIAAYHIHP